jgi:hypothetical protein
MTLAEFIEMMGKKPVSEFPDVFTVNYMDGDLESMSMDRRRLAALLLRLANGNEWEIRTGDTIDFGYTHYIRCKRLVKPEPEKVGIFEPSSYYQQLQAQFSKDEAARMANRMQNNIDIANRGALAAQMSQKSNSEYLEKMLRDFGVIGNVAPPTTAPVPKTVPPPEEKIDRETRRTITLE